MAVGLYLSGVGLVVGINLGEFIYVLFKCWQVWPVNLHCISSLLVGKCLDHVISQSYGVAQKADPVQGVPPTYIQQLYIQHLFELCLYVCSRLDKR